MQRKRSPAIPAFESCIVRQTADNLRESEPPIKICRPFNVHPRPPTAYDDSGELAPRSHHACRCWSPLIGRIMRERPPRSLHFAPWRMNIAVRSKIMSHIGCGLNELWSRRNDHYRRLFVQRDSIRVRVRSSYHPHLLVPRLPISRSW
jgi:hypothetical protein